MVMVLGPTGEMLKLIWLLPEAALAARIAERKVQLEAEHAPAVSAAEFTTHVNVAASPDAGVRNVDASKTRQPSIVGPLRTAQFLNLGVKGDCSAQR